MSGRDGTRAELFSGRVGTGAEQFSGRVGTGAGLLCGRERERGTWSGSSVMSVKASLLSEVVI